MVLFDEQIMVLHVEILRNPMVLVEDFELILG